MDLRCRCASKEEKKSREIERWEEREKEYGEMSEMKKQKKKKIYVLVAYSKIETAALTLRYKLSTSWRHFSRFKSHASCVLVRKKKSPIILDDRKISLSLHAFAIRLSVLKMCQFIFHSFSSSFSFLFVFLFKNNLFSWSLHL